MVVGDRNSRYLGQVGPYREAQAADVLEAPSRDGVVRLEVAPRHTLLSIGQDHDVTVTEHFVTVTRASSQGRRKKRSLRLDSTRLLVARAIPTEDVGIWLELEPGVVTRLLGIRPIELLDDEALDAWRALDRLVKRLRGALSAHAHGVARALELGRGADRVLIMDLDDRLIFHVRRLFRERPRRALEVHADGTVVFPRKARPEPDERCIRCTSRFGVTATGDYVRFADDKGQDLGSFFLPWVAPEDRDEIARIIAEHIERRA